MLSAELKAEADNTYGDLDYYFRISLKPDLVILFYSGFVLLLKLLENYLNIFCKFKGA